MSFAVIIVDVVECKHWERLGLPRLENFNRGYRQGLVCILASHEKKIHARLFYQMGNSRWGVSCGDGERDVSREQDPWNRREVCYRV